MKKISTWIFTFVLSLNFVWGQPAKKSEINVTVRFEQNRPGDTLYLSMAKYFFSFPSDLSSNLTKAVVDSRGECRFTIPVEQQCGRFSILKSFDLDTNFFEKGRAQQLHFLVSDYFWERGDNFLINVERYKTSPVNSISVFYDFHYNFNGIGAEKNNSRFKADSVYYYTNEDYDSSSRPFDQSYKYQDTHSPNIQAALQVLNKDKSMLTDFYFGVIRSDIVFRGSAGRFKALKLYYDSQIKNDSALRAEFLNKYAGALKKYIQDFSNPDSYEYIQYLNKKVLFDDYAAFGDPSPDRINRSIITGFEGVSRDRLLTLSLTANTAPNFNMLHDSALALVKDPASRWELEKLKSRRSGREPYLFNLPDQHGDYIKLDDFKGKVVFVDFWFTGCGACVTYYNTVLSKAEEHFSSKNIVFVTISSDVGKSLWLKSIKSGKYVSDKSINLFTEGQGDKHPAIQQYKFNTYPSFLLIDRQGKIKEFNSDQLAKRDPDNLIRVLQNAIDAK